MRRYDVGDYQLDEARDELRRAGVPVSIAPQAFKVLAYLLQQRDRVVPTDELLTHVWPQQFISAATLGRCIRAVRHAVGDSRRHQRVIQTVDGRGYRCIAVVEAVETQESITLHPDAGDLRC